MVSAQQQLQHLYWRAGFGPRPEDIATALKPRKALEHLLRSSEKVELLDSPQMHAAELRPMMPASPTGALAGSQPEPPMLRRGTLTPEQRRALNQGIRGAFYAMNTGWLERMATSPAQLREKMTFFWHGHFACRVRRPAAALQLNNTIRRLALGNFGELLLAVSREPAMLQFLNNQQNRKQHPNENFAREVMELFTLGRGHYSEADVQAAARAFTGWSADANNQFVFRERQHDAGSKTFLGRTDNLGGEDVLQLILEQPQTAEFITTKLYRFLVNDTPNIAHIKPLAQDFYRSQYNISRLLERLFSASWFYDTANVGTRIKSPIELLVGIQRTCGLTLDNPRPLIGLQKALGQTLFKPPNVAGWPGGRNWIDSSSLLLRLQLPQVLLKNAELNVTLKEDENDIAPSVAKADRTFQQPLTTQLNLASLHALLAQTPPLQQAQQLSELLLQTPIRPASLALVQQAARQAPAEGQIQAMLTSLLSLPEYQLM